MGYSGYSESSRATRSAKAGYSTNSMNENFRQNVERKIHAEMDPKGVKIREARDSVTHPISIPIILGLDFTGSMGHIPQDLIAEGLPKLMSGIIQNGVPDPALMFIGLGDHECDRAPLQISQFESGDEELDMWLTRSYIESGGGGNPGESYGLAWYFAANHTATDHWDKRGQKGFLFTIGDEPNLTSFPASAIKEIMGEGQYSTMTDKSLLAAAQEKWHVFHILPGKETRNAKQYWTDLLGQNAIWIDSPNRVPDTIKKIVLSHYVSPTGASPAEPGQDWSGDRPEIML